MKKELGALLLAGVFLASLSSCITPQGKPTGSIPYAVDALKRGNLPKTNKHFPERNYNKAEDPAEGNLYNIRFR